MLGGRSMVVMLARKLGSGLRTRRRLGGREAMGLMLGRGLCLGDDKGEVETSGVDRKVLMWT